MPEGVPPEPKPEPGPVQEPRVELKPQPQSKLEPGQKLESEPHKQINFVAGDTVVVHGLRNNVEANGRREVVQSFDSIHGRYIVLIDGNSKPAKLKPQNLHTELEPELEPEPEPEQKQ